MGAMGAMGASEHSTIVCDCHPSISCLCWFDSDLSGDKVLDLGCWPGSWTLYAARSLGADSTESKPFCLIS